MGHLFLSKEHQYSLLHIHYSQSSSSQCILFLVSTSLHGKTDEYNPSFEWLEIIRTIELINFFRYKNLECKKLKVIINLSNFV